MVSSCMQSPTGGPLEGARASEWALDLWRRFAYHAAMTSPSRLEISLRALLQSRRTAALAVQPLADVNGTAYLPAPMLSMVPWAWDAAHGCLALHVSALVPHTAAMERHAAVGLLVSADESAAELVQGLERVSLTAVASTPEPGSELAQSLRASYLQRFPEAEPLTQLGDFRFVCLTPVLAHYVAGFGAVRDYSGQELAELLNQP